MLKAYVLVSSLYEFLDSFEQRCVHCEGKLLKVLSTEKQQTYLPGGPPNTNIELLLTLLLD